MAMEVSSAALACATPPAHCARMRGQLVVHVGSFFSQSVGQRVSIVGITPRGGVCVHAAAERVCVGRVRSSYSMGD